MLDSIFASFNYEIKRKTIVGTANSETGEYKTYYLPDIKPEDLYLPIASSSAVGGILTPVPYDNGVNFDGGSVNGMDPISAVSKCLEVVESPANVTLDVILLNRVDIPDPETDA